MSPLISLLRSPRRMTRLSLSQWDVVIRDARAAGVLGRLAWLAGREGVEYVLPAQPRAHLRWALIRAESCARDARYEVALLEHILRDTLPSLILLKGAAYVVAGASAAGGRFFEDIDILVPFDALEAAEGALVAAGWLRTHLSEYDQRYYREWTHELPPLKHAVRGTSVDVHFNILPRLGRLHPNAERLAKGSVAVSPDGWLRTLGAHDRVLHSAAHLFQNGEFERGLRDLSDIDLLIGDATHAEPDFWRALPARAFELELAGPCYFALRLCAELLGTEVPGRALEDLASAAGGYVGRGALARTFRSAMTPASACSDTFGARIARFVLFVRSHWIRMPVTVLVPHLIHKARQRPQAGNAPV